ncbi:SEC-C metal-binding domain-containing protein [Caballeronia sp. GaOx3]|uniref:SEC-C metal-binding domain-containing protein n=1 Tax=Caballeronia sp. GaOx3 TaxID=2921740 RepID=UPI0020288C42|nr:SEC-C metal-binding domain-containing protein [Caballeronia sp. GaOx3]
MNVRDRSREAAGNWNAGTREFHRVCRKMTSETPPIVTKSGGVTNTERMLAEFCERSFLKLWSYPNPFKDDGHELCDLLAVFGDHVFIFFDRENVIPEASEKDPHVLWDRWKRNVIDRQVRTAHGAERYIRSKRPIFVDNKGEVSFPLSIDAEKAVVHKIIVAHGAKEACKRASEKNIYGSLSIDYCETEGDRTRPFHVEIDRHHPVHIFDSHNFSIVLSELDTVADLSSYLNEKLRAIGRFASLSYCGEEDLLAHYLFNYDKEKKQHVIGPEGSDVDFVMIGEGEWHDFVETDIYRNTKKEDEISYFWDELIQRTCKSAIDGTIGGNADLFRGKNAIFEMVKEPRFIRRALSDAIRRTVINFPDQPGQMTRKVSLLPSIRADVGYVFFQLRAPEIERARPEYLDLRRAMLEVACGAAKNKFMHLTKVIGIGMDAPKFAGDKNSEDFILLECEEWSDECKADYEERNRRLRFFESDRLRKHEETVSRFVAPRDTVPSGTVSGKIGRNQPCPCRSGRKFKRCHGG